MAKKPTAATAKAADTAPSQPWAKPAAETKQDSAPATGSEGNAPAPVADTQNPPENAPAAQQSEAHGNEEANKAEGNQLEAPPVATDERDRLQQALESLDEDERAEFEEHMTREATATLVRIVKRREAKAMEANMVEGSRHYGKRVPTAGQEG